MAKTSIGLEENVAGALCYLLTWFSGLIILLLERENKTVRFHALQSLILFLGLHIIIIVISWIPLVNFVVVSLLTILGIILWVVLIVQTWKGQQVKIPGVSDIAEKYA